MTAKWKRRCGGPLRPSQELGVIIQEVSIPSMEYAGALNIAAMADRLVTHEPYINANREDYGPDTLYRTLAGQFVLGRDYSKSMKVQRIIKEEHARILTEVDFLVTPRPRCPRPASTRRTSTLTARTTVSGGRGHPLSPGTPAP